MFRPPNLPMRSFEVGLMPHSPREIAIRHCGKLIYSHTCNFIVDARLVLVEWKSSSWKIQGMQMHATAINPNPTYRAAAPVFRVPRPPMMMDTRFGFAAPSVVEDEDKVAVLALLSLGDAAQEALDAIEAEDAPPSHIGRAATSATSLRLQQPALISPS